MKHLLFLHGALGTSASFNSLKEELSEYFHCHLFNFSGHGGESFQNQFSISQFTKELNSYISKHKLDDCLVFGHSMGGYIALNSSATGNRKIKKIMTLGTKFFWTEEIAEKESVLLEPEKLKLQIPSLVRHLEQLHGDNWEELVTQIKVMILSLGRQPNLDQIALKSINIPVILCIGEMDKMVTFEETTDTKNKIAQSTVVSLPSQPHPIEAVDKKKLKQLILEHLF